MYAIRKNVSAWGRFTASEPGACLAKEWDADWLSTCWNCVNVSFRAYEFVCDGKRAQEGAAHETEDDVMCTCTWAPSFLNKYMNSALCEGMRLYIFVQCWKPGSRGYCCALGWSWVNSSLTPVHYGPLLLPSRCSAVTHRQPPLFHTQCKSLTPSSPGQRGSWASYVVSRWEILPVRLCFFKCVFMHTCRGRATNSGPPDSGSLRTLEAYWLKSYHWLTSQKNWL